MTAISVRDERFDGAIVQGLLAEWNDELGFAPKGGSTVADSDFTPPDGVFLVAQCDGAPAGCAGLRRLDATTGEVKRLFVRRATRGRGVGRALLEALEQRARAAGLRALRLDTDGGNAAALALFRAAGYEPIGDYNANPYARRWFEKRLGAPGGDD